MGFRAGWFVAAAFIMLPAAAPAAPGAPTDLGLVTRVDGSAQLEWTPGAGTVHGFKIRRSNQSGSFPDPTYFPNGKQAAFTFCTDDGLVDNLVYDPILTSRGLRLTAFVNPGLVGNGNRMGWAQIESLFLAGHEIQNHTHTHTALIDDRALTVRYLGAGSCSLLVRVDTLATIVGGVRDLEIVLTDSTAKYLDDLSQLIDAHSDYESTLLYATEHQYATQSNHIDPVNPAVEIGLGAPAETLTTARGVHDDAELRAEILNAEADLEWSSPDHVDTSRANFEASSKASGLTSPRWL